MLRRRSLGRPFGRHGVVVLRGAPASAELHEAVRLAVARHFAGVAVLLGPDRAIEPAVVATADRAGLFLLAGVFEPAAARVTGTGP